MRDKLFSSIALDVAFSVTKILLVYISRSYAYHLSMLTYCYRRYLMLVIEVPSSAESHGDFSHRYLQCYLIDGIKFPPNRYHSCIVLSSIYILSVKQRVIPTDLKTKRKFDKGQRVI